jgi:hypothetical protein
VLRFQRALPVCLFEDLSGLKGSVDYSQRRVILMEGMFPMDVPKNTRFAINYFTSIGLGVITEEMRVYLKVGSLAMVFLGRFEILTNVNNLECPIN